MDDEIIYKQVQAGDEAAVTALVTRYHVLLFNFLYRYTGDQALAEDLVQETFIRILTYKGAIPHRLKVWIHTIAINLARDYFRTARYKREDIRDFEDLKAYIEVAQKSSEDNLLQTRDEVKAAIERLSPEHREVLVLRFYQDFKLEEIADMTGIPAGTVRSRLFYALKQLKSMLTVAESIPHDRS